LSDNDEDKKKDEKSDLTRIEDLSEFLHDENEDMSGLETYSEDDDLDDDEILDQATDPDIEFPPEFKATEDSAESEQSDDYNTSFESDEEDAFGDDSFGNDSDDSFGNDYDDSFGNDSDDSFGNDSDDSFGNDSDDSFGNDSDDSFGNDSDDSFGNDSNDLEDTFSNDEEKSFDDDSNSEISDEINDEVALEENDNDENEFDDEFSDFDNEQTQNDSYSVESEKVTPEIASPDQVTEEPVPIDTPPLQTEQPKNESVQKTPIEQFEDKKEYKGPENFNELQKFAQNISYGNMGHEGNPPFSIIIKDIKFKEDIEEIITILSEYGIFKDEDLEKAFDSLSRGNMLIPRLGEYSAIHLCHKLRKFDISILMGLTEEIHPPRSYESDDSGIVSKYTVYNTKSHHYIYNHDEVKLEDIIASTTPHLEGYHIKEYITIGSEYIILDAKTLSGANLLESDLKSAIPEYQKSKVDKSEVRSANLQASKSQVLKDFFPSNSEEIEDKTNSSNLNDIYKSLLEKLKLSALKNKGNAIVGIHYNVTPIVKEESYYTETNYQVTCSGSIVWANKV